jgi:biotin carboxyl carrier protein
VNSQPVETTIDPNRRWIKSTWGVHSLQVCDLDVTIAPLRNGNGHVQAPIPGLMVQVKISTGDLVQAGQPLFVLEAMKMENEIRAPRSGIIKIIYVSPGQGVALGQTLAEID